MSNGAFGETAALQGAGGAADAYAAPEPPNESDDEPDDSLAFECPLSFAIMDDPVTLPHSPHVYERAPLVEWLLKDHTCPMTREPAEVGDVVDADPEFKARLRAYHAKKGLYT